jgi:hypothetical protein
MTAATTATTTVLGTVATPVMADAALSPSPATTDRSKELGAAAKASPRTTALRLLMVSLGLNANAHAGIVHPAVPALC